MLLDSATTAGEAASFSAQDKQKRSESPFPSHNKSPRSCIAPRSSCKDHKSKERHRVHSAKERCSRKKKKKKKKEQKDVVTSNRGRRGLSSSSRGCLTRHCRSCWCHFRARFFLLHKSNKKQKYELRVQRRNAKSASLLPLKEKKTDKCSKSSFSVPLPRPCLFSLSLSRARALSLSLSVALSRFVVHAVVHSGENY